MIKDEKQYEYTQYLAGEFKKSIAAMERDEERKRNDPDRWELNRSALQCHLDKLQEEIAEYENLVSHDSRTPIVLTLDDIYYFPQLLIKSRMAAKLSQKELADLAGLTEEQIKNYEDKDYEDASFMDVMGVFFALDIKVQGEFLVPLDTLRRTPVTKEELLSSSKKTNREQTSIA